MFPPRAHDPHGIHGAIWEAYDAEDYVPPPDKPLTVAAYLAASLPEAFLEPVAIGQDLPEMPIFLQRDCYVNAPLEASYEAAYRGLPAYWRGVLERNEITSARK